MYRIAIMIAFCVAVVFGNDRIVSYDHGIRHIERIQHYIDNKLSSLVTMKMDKDTVLIEGSIITKRYEVITIVTYSNPKEKFVVKRWLPSEIVLRDDKLEKQW